jgi:hypothetical protein
MTCDLGCVKPMGASVPRKVKIVESQGIKSVLERMDRLRERLATKVLRTRRRLTSTVYGVQDLAASEAQVGFLQERVVELEDPIEAASKRKPEARGDWLPAAAVAVGLGFGVMIPALVWRRRARVRRAVA